MIEGVEYSYHIPSWDELQEQCRAFLWRSIFSLPYLQMQPQTPPTLQIVVICGDERDIGNSINTSIRYLRRSLRTVLGSSESGADGVADIPTTNPGLLNGLLGRAVRPRGPDKALSKPLKLILWRFEMKLGGCNGPGDMGSHLCLLVYSLKRSLLTPQGQVLNAEPRTFVPVERKFRAAKDS